MPIALNPYISFKKQAREAMEFYRSVFGGKVEFTTFKDLHASQDPSEDDMIMHAQLQTDDGFTLMGSDTPDRVPFNPSTRISLSVGGDDSETLTGYFNRLSEGGAVRMPLERAPWGDTFGMCVDKYGVSWMVSISTKK